MTWLHNFFGLFFIPAASRAKSAQQLISTVLPFHPLYFPWEGVKNPANSGDDSNLCEIHNNLVAQCACFGSIVQPELYIFSLRNSTTTTSTTTICFFYPTLFENVLSNFSSKTSAQRDYRNKSRCYDQKKQLIFFFVTSFLGHQ